MPLVNDMDEDESAVCDEIRIIFPDSLELTLESVPAPSEVNIVFPPASLTVFG